MSRKGAGPQKEDRGAYFVFMWWHRYSMRLCCNGPGTITARALSLPCDEQKNAGQGVSAYLFFLLLFLCRRPPCGVCWIRYFVNDRFFLSRGRVQIRLWWILCFRALIWLFSSVEGNSWEICVALVGTFFSFFLVNLWPRCVQLWCYRKILVPALCGNRLVSLSSIKLNQSGVRHEKSFVVPRGKHSFCLHLVSPYTNTSRIGGLVNSLID